MLYDHPLYDTVDPVVSWPWSDSSLGGRRMKQTHNQKENPAQRPSQGFQGNSMPRSLSGQVRTVKNARSEPCQGDLSLKTDGTEILWSYHRESREVSGRNANRLTLESSLMDCRTGESVVKQISSKRL